MSKVAIVISSDKYAAIATNLIEHWGVRVKACVFNLETDDYESCTDHKFSGPYDVCVFITTTRNEMPLPQATLTIAYYMAPINPSMDILKNLANVADLVAVPHALVIENLNKHNPSVSEHILIQKLKTLPVGIDTNKFRPLNPYVREPSKLEARYYLLDGKVKDEDLLILCLDSPLEAVATVQEIQRLAPNLKPVLVSTTAIEGVPNIVVKVTDINKRYLYGLVDLVIVPTLESWPTTVVEAIACDTLVAAKSGYLNSIFLADNFGLLLPTVAVSNDISVINPTRTAEMIIAEINKKHSSAAYNWLRASGELDAAVIVNKWLELITWK